MKKTNDTAIDIDETTEPDNLLRTYILFIQTARDVLRYIDARLYREAGSSLPQMIVLQALYFQNSVMTPSALSAWTQTESHNVTTLIRRMQRDGLINTERSRGNKRIVKVMLNEKGQELLMRIMPVAREIVDQAMSSLNTDEAARLERILKMIRSGALSGLEAMYKK
jgi:DNA-binding MarR family transcriptional regulator